MGLKILIVIILISILVNSHREFSSYYWKEAFKDNQPKISYEWSWNGKIYRWYDPERNNEEGGWFFDIYKTGHRVWYDLWHEEVPGFQHDPWQKLEFFYMRHPWEYCMITDVRQTLGIMCDRKLATKHELYQIFDVVMTDPDAIVNIHISCNEMVTQNLQRASICWCYDIPYYWVSAIKCHDRDILNAACPCNTLLLQKDVFRIYQNLISLRLLNMDLHFDSQNVFNGMHQIQHIHIHNKNQAVGLFPDLCDLPNLVLLKLDGWTVKFTELNASFSTLGSQFPIAWLFFESSMPLSTSYPLVPGWPQQPLYKIFHLHFVLTFFLILTLSKT